METKLLLGDSLEVMATMPESSVDSVVTDPPYGLKFMGRGWDAGVPGVAYWQAVLRVAKPGAMLLAFGGTRTHHRLMVAIEDAGWEIRDCLMWLYGSGFPKSHDISKAIDKAAGAEREVIGYHKQSIPQISPRSNFGDRFGEEGNNNAITAPTTDAAKEWDGWGTALKPAWEPIIMARKPLSGTVAENVLAWGTGGINVDACRVGHDEPLGKPSTGMAGKRAGIMGETVMRHRENTGPNTQGRWPANLLLDEEAGALLDEQSGVLASGARNGVKSERVSFGEHGTFAERAHDSGNNFVASTGGASRFFYVAKASKKDRGIGNDHPTVKPTSLMRWLVKLVTPPGGVVLDPFMGSGSTGKAAMLEGFGFTGIDNDPESLEIARHRVTE